MALNTMTSISGLKNIFALSIMCCVISAMRNFHVTAMSLDSRGDMDDSMSNYIEELSRRKNPRIELSAFPFSVGGTRPQEEGLRLDDDDNNDYSIGADQTEDETSVNDARDSSSSWRNKRFLGSRARVNWFPSSFRQFIDSDMYPGADLTTYRHAALLSYPEKKHVGHVTHVKLVSLPSSFSGHKNYLQDEEDDYDEE